MLSKRLIIRLYFLCAILAFGIGVSDFMYTQENIMAILYSGITGIGVLFATMVWSLMLLPPPTFRFKAPPLGITVFMLFILYTLVVIVLMPKGDMSTVLRIIRMSMHVLFALVMVGTYRWYSSNELSLWEKRCLVVVFAMLAVTYMRVMLLCISNLQIEHLGISYYMLFALPLVLMVKQWKWKVLFIVIAFAIILSSMKRGGAAALVIGLIVYFMVYLKIRSYNIIKAFTFLVVALAVLAAAFLFFGSQEVEGEQMTLVERFENVGQDGGSNRDRVYSKTIDLIASQEGVEWIVGNGYNAVLVDSPIHYSAHNDYLEILYDYGIIGLLMYIFFTLSFFRLALRLFLKKDEFAPIVCFQFSNFILMGNVSHIFIYMLMALVAFTYGLGQGRMRKISSTVQKETEA